jgi:hypothetical protein
VRPVRLILALSLLAGLAGTADRASAFVIDSFDDPFPPHPLLVDSGRRIVFVGSACDGAACPPGTVVAGDPSGDAVDQEALPGVFGGERGFVLSDYSSATSGEVTATIATGRLEVSQAVGDATQVYINYGGYLVYWNLDMAALGIDRFVVDVPVVSPGLTLEIELTVPSGHPPNDTVATLARTITSAGSVTFPLASFSGVADWTHVRFLLVRIHGTGDAPWTYAVGGITADATPTAVAPTSWGRVKSSYR